MSAIDQKLLYLIKLYADSDVDMSKFSPFLWGKPAVIHYSVMNATSMYLWKQPKLQDVLSLLSSDMTENTILNYPLELQLQPCQQNMNNLLEEKVTGDTVYDLRFLLPLFAALLSPGAYIHCQSFVLSKSLMLLFTSLSSFDPNTRALGYYCISQFYQHLEGSFYGEKSIWLSLFDCVRNSISRPNPRIPSIISLFLAKVIDIFTKPDNNMYTILYKFIMVKPVFDIGNVPEFYVLFNSNEIEHREHRRWLLNILAKGLRTASDFHICKKRYIFSTLLSHYWSSICTHDEKVLIINIITAAVKTESSARSLCQNGLLSWLHNVIEQVAVIDAEIVKLSSFILKNLWHAVKSNSVADDDPTSAENLDSLDVKKGSTNDTNHKKIYSSFFYEFQLVLFCFLKKLNFLEGPSLNAYLSTFLHILNHMENSESYYVKYRLCLQHAIIIHEKWQECAENRNKNLQSGESSSESTNVHKCFEIFPKIILYWQ
ncbi:Nucleolar pre-ribosomal-associated protein 1, partial [Stegodyphus mimosarum]